MAKDIEKALAGNKDEEKKKEEKKKKPEAPKPVPKQRRDKK